MREGEQNCFLTCGKEFVALFKADKPSMNHYCYSIPRYDPDEVVKRLKDAGLSPRRRSDRVYFDDPDGLEVQVAAVRR
jgi:catechol 2,3-dioxygenase-like lactoylglutathione lyase family enzyme